MCLTSRQVRDYGGDSLSPLVNFARSSADMIKESFNVAGADNLLGHFFDLLCFPTISCHSLWKRSIIAS